MPSIKTTTPILGGRYYHIFNRGANRQLIFYSADNYNYFLKLFNELLADYMHFFAYCLLPNHFHFVVKIKDELVFQEENRQKENRSSSTQNIGNGSLKKQENRSLSAEDIKNGSLKQITDEEEIGKIVVRQLKRLFITYAMAINKQENRVGNLFDPKYKRLEITTQDYLEYVIFYAHYNPEKHGLTTNFKDYRYSSFKAIKTESKTNIDREFVLELYGGKDEFLNYHSVMHDERHAVILE